MILVPFTIKQKTESVGYTLYVTETEAEFYTACENNRKHGRVFYCDAVKKIKIVVSCGKDSMTDDFVMFVAKKLVEFCNAMSTPTRTGKMKIETVFYCRTELFLGSEKKTKIHEVKM